MAAGHQQETRRVPELLNTLLVVLYGTQRRAQSRQFLNVGWLRGPQGLEVFGDGEC